MQKGHNRIKIGGDHWTLGDRDPKCKCKKVCGTKTVEQKVMRTVQKGHNRIKIGGDHWTLGDGDPKCRYKKVSGTKTVEQKQNKNSGTKTVEQKLVGTLRHWVLGILSASVKMSVEENQQNKNWWGSLGTPSANTKRSAEQKQWIKTAEPKFVGILRHWVTCKCKKVSGTKIGGDPWGPQVQVQKGLWNKKWLGPLGIPSATTKRSAKQKQQNKKWWRLSDIG